jgi:type I restriction enzyme M protein
LIRTSPHIFWLNDDAREDSENLPEPSVLAAEAVKDLEAALEQFRTIAEDLGQEVETE